MGAGAVLRVSCTTHSRHRRCAPPPAAVAHPFINCQAGKAKRFSPLWRPMFPPSKKNVESMDAQAERDRMQQDFLRNKHLKNAGPAHHIAPQKDVFAGPWDGTTGMDGKPRNYVDRFVKYRGTENILEHDASKYSKRPSTA